MSDENRPIDVLITVSATMATVCLAVVAIISAKDALTHIDSITDDLFLFASLGFLGTVSLGYWSTKHSDQARAKKFVTVAEWCFSASLVAILVGGVLLVYTTM